MLGIYLAKFTMNLLVKYFSLIFMERKGKAVATTSAQNQGGHNGDGDDERKRKEADEAYRRLQIRKAEKAIAECHLYLSSMIFIFIF
jgi:hypothetical protein